MKKNVRLYLQDILESISAIEEYTLPLTEEKFYGNRQTQDAVIRRLEIIGETAKNIGEETNANILTYRGKRLLECGMFLFTNISGLI